MPGRPAGDPVVIREVWRRRIFAARPALVVQDEPGQTMLLVPPRVGCGVPIGPDGAELRLPDRPWHLEVRPRGQMPVLSFAWPGTPYAVLRWTSGSGTPVWYVNLQSPLEPTILGFDTTDHVLDAIVELDGSWRWKDEEGLELAVRRGLFTSEQARGFRAEAERAVARILDREPPFDHDWSTWQADSSWPEPALPDGWDRL